MVGVKKSGLKPQRLQTTNFFPVPKQEEDKVVGLECAQKFLTTYLDIWTEMGFEECGNSNLQVASGHKRSKRSLICRLEEVDPRKMKHEEKLAFWINIHNALVMHVRVYTSKRVFQELEVAKEEYIRATFGVRKDHKILLPKIVESFAKDSGLCQAGVIEMIQKCLPESVRKSIKKCQSGKSRKSIEWVPYNFAFRYLIPKELVK
ncbi:hypothetical protein Vadar_034039 [Vaccinium darrowii]|uniref:Uncharacterized protein n=1 Tax=Vaccinium darrowii TaxID=229202 RepID=A0ACB7YJZ3_9ERIC|nr:hypothetical protein Vadar_034039 [Vaccinium darrowii]